MKRKQKVLFKLYLGKQLCWLLKHAGVLYLDLWLFLASNCFLLIVGNKHWEIKLRTSNTASMKWACRDTFSAANTNAERYAEEAAATAARGP